MKEIDKDEFIKNILIRELNQKIFSRNFRNRMLRRFKANKNNLPFPHMRENPENAIKLCTERRDTLTKEIKILKEEIKKIKSVII